MADKEPKDQILEILRELSTQVGRRWQGKQDLIDIINDELIWIEEELEEIGEGVRSEYRDVPELVREDIGRLPLFELAEMAQAVAHLLVNHRPSRIPKDVLYVFAGLSTRAIATFREITLLLEHGYAFGAKARW